METFYIKNLTDLKNNLELLQKKLKVALAIKGRQVTISGEALNEYEASIVMNAISFGFSVQAALTLTEEDFIFRVIRIKEVTKRKDLGLVKARVIGLNGKTKKTLEHLADCKLVIKDNEVGIIGPAEDIEDATAGIESLIRGSKQSNIYKYFERRNREKKEYRWKDTLNPTKRKDSNV